jgi:DNA-binding transcriptional MocR family regulator
MEDERIVSEPLPALQFVERPGIIDLAWGHPEAALLPLEALRAAAMRAFDHFGTDLLAYGRAAGPGPLIEEICRRLGEIDARAPAADEVLVTSGASQGLDQVASLLTDPGDVVLVEAPTYHLAVSILRDHPVQLVAVPADGGGVGGESLARAIHGVRKAGGRPRLLYTVPTYHNPTGLSLSLDRRSELVALAASEGIVIVEDDAYRELSYDGPPPASLWSLSASPGTVVRLGTFAKSIAPGLRLGYLTADPRTVSRFADGGMLDSAGGANHFTAMVVAQYMRDGDHAGQVDLFRNAYRERRDRLLAALPAAMPEGTTWTRPDGGYFVWITLPDAFDGSALLAVAEAMGTRFVPGSTFYLDRGGGTHSIRLAFSRYPPEILEEAVARLAAATSGGRGRGS